MLWLYLVSLEGVDLGSDTVRNDPGSCPRRDPAVSSFRFCLCVHVVRVVACI